VIPWHLDGEAARDVIESLRSGIPPRRFVSCYSSGHDAFIDDVRRRQFQSPSTRGKIRFISGSWGSGKTHMLRLLREAAFEAGYLVSTVELSADQTPFNKFEQVFFDIVRNVTSPAMYAEGDLHHAAPFGEVLRRTLLGPEAGRHEDVTHDRFREASEALFTHSGIDIDVRRLIVRYWETFLPEGGDSIAREDVRGQIVQWFAGEGSLSSYRTPFQVQKTVTRGNARLLFQSLSRFARHAGYRGLVVLFDEAEMSYSVMRRSNLKEAHNNLLHLINSISESDGAFLIYAATPDFFIDERHGIVIYGALAQRIGQPSFTPPRALDRIWNLDALETRPEDYLDAARKIREIYLLAELDAVNTVLADGVLRRRIAELVRVHPEFSHVSTWRVVITGTIKELDRSGDGDDEPPVERLHADILAQLREQ